MNQFRRQNSNYGRKEAGNGGKIIFLALACALLYGYFSKKPSHPINKYLTSLEAKTSLAPADMSSSDNRPERAIPSSGNLKQRRLSLLGKETAGISTLRTSSSGDEITVPIIFRPKTIWCQGGDLDTLRYAMPDSSAPDVLVSLESMNGDRRASSFRVSALDLYKGFSHNFKIKTNRAGESLALFICKDSAKSNSCQSKKVRTHAEISKLLSDEKSSETAKGDDYLLYFQSLIVREGTVNIFKANDYLQKDVSILKNQLAAQLSVKESDFKKTWSYASAIKSLPARIERESIIISMLYNDPRCSKSFLP